MRWGIIAALILFTNASFAKGDAGVTNAVAIVIATHQGTQRASNAVVITSENFDNAVLTSRNIIAGADKVEVFFQGQDSPAVASNMLVDLPDYDLAVIEINVPENIDGLALGDCFPGVEVDVIHATALDQFNIFKGYVSGTMLARDLLPDDRTNLFGKSDLISNDSAKVGSVLVQTEPAIGAKNLPGILSCSPVINSNAELVSLVWKDSYIGTDESGGQLGGIVSNQLKTLLAQPVLQKKKITALEPTGFQSVNPIHSENLLKQVDAFRELSFEDDNISRIIDEADFSKYRLRSPIAVGTFPNVPGKKIHLEMDPLADPPQPSDKDGSVFSICNYKTTNFRNGRVGWLVVRYIKTSEVKAIAHFDNNSKPDDIQVLFHHGRPRLVIKFLNGKASSFAHYIDGIRLRSGAIENLNGTEKEYYDELEKLLFRIQKNERRATTMTENMKNDALRPLLGRRMIQANQRIQQKENEGRMRQYLEAQRAGNGAALRTPPPGY